VSEVDKIKKLRDETGLSMGEINKALKEAGGDENKARELLGGLGSAMAAKKSSRAVNEGVVEAYIHSNRKMGALVELLCETDFVARNDEFKSLAKDLAMQVAAMKPENAQELLSQQFIKDPNLTVNQLVSSAVAKLGENIQIGRFQIFEI
jgi:elongation factor Ts